MSQLETHENLERARERLRGRDPAVLVDFLLSLASATGPVGDQVRTFIVADDVAETVDAVRRRIAGIGAVSEYEHRHSLGREIGATLDFIVDSVERLVLPNDSRAAFELLTSQFEVDAKAMENCGDHDWSVTCAYKRAAGVMARAAQRLPRAEVEERVRGLLDGDMYGVRAVLASVLPDEHVTGDGAAR